MQFQTIRMKDLTSKLLKWRSDILLDSQNTTNLFLVLCYIFSKTTLSIFCFFMFENSLDCLWVGFVIFYILLPFSRNLLVTDVNRPHICIQHITVDIKNPKFCLSYILYVTQVSCLTKTTWQEKCAYNLITM